MKQVVDSTLELVRLRNEQGNGIAVYNFGAFFIQHLRNRNWELETWVCLRK